MNLWIVAGLVVMGLIVLVLWFGALMNAGHRSTMPKDPSLYLVNWPPHAGGDAWREAPPAIEAARSVSGAEPSERTRAAASEAEKK